MSEEKKDEKKEEAEFKKVETDKQSYVRKVVSHNYGQLLRSKYGI
jgi:3-methyladenine DNA glycosylase AlkC